MALLRQTSLLAIGFLLAGCAPSGPLRKADPETLVQSSGDNCKALYASTDDDIYRAATNFQLGNDGRKQFLDAEKKKILATPEVERPCWETAFEHHGTYDLFYAEFDDQGDATDVAKGAPYETSELHLIEAALSDMLDRKDDPETGLNIVVFTHGWHGNPRADNSYSMEFKSILQDISRREEILRVKRQFKPASGKNESKPYRTVGIEIAWRGDSFDTYLNVWDRKLAAQTISNGAVQELFAFLNQFYRDHSCDSAEHGTALSQDACGDVHMLAIGHSFGALITFRALVPRLESGINVGPCYHAYGFGDITILLNPAFEGERYRALFNDAVHRPLLKGDYYGDNGAPQKCESAGTAIRAGPQIPTLVTLQSEGDWATGNAFPIFLRLTTPFAQTLSDEEEYEKNHAIGWVPAFQTHTLAINPAVGAKDSCPQLPSGTKAFCPFEDTYVRTDEVGTKSANARSPLLLTLAPGASKPSQLPDYLPLWSVAVNSEIMYDHDDFWNPHIVRLIDLLFEDAYEQSERLHGRRRQ